MPTDIPTNEGRRLLEQMQDELAAPDVRLQLGFTFSISEGVLPVCQVWNKTERGNFVRSKLPMVVGKDSDSRADVLRTMADIIDANQDKPDLAPEALLTWQSVANLETHTDIGPGNVTPLLIQVNFRQWEQACDLLREAGHLR